MPLPNLPTVATVPSGLRDPSSPINDVFNALAALIGPAQSSTLTTPPTRPADGAVYLIPSSPSATGVWSGQNGKIAVWSDARPGFTYLPAFRGHMWRVLDSNNVVDWNGADWESVVNPSGAIGALSQDPSPQLGGGLDGNNQAVRGVRVAVRTVDQITWTWDLHDQDHIYTLTDTCTFILPATALQGSFFGLLVDNDPGIVVFQPGPGASLSSGALGPNIGSCRTVSADRKIFFEVKKNLTGSGAAWVALGDHQA